MRIGLAISLLVLVVATPSLAAEEVFLASGPDLSPDGGTLLYSWHGDIWSVPTSGGTATALTRHPADDSTPFFSPDGTEIAFASDRGTGVQVFVMPANGGEPKQITFDTEGVALLGWFPDGKGLLVRMSTDRAWRDNLRFFRIERDRRTAPVMLFDASGGAAQISPDGRTVLFSRDGMAWWWKGYRGPRASQVWSYDTETKAFSKILHRDAGARYPTWAGTSGKFVFTDMADREGNLHLFDPETGTSKALTSFETDTVVAPTVSRDGRTIVFRHRFAFYRLRLGVDTGPEKIAIVITGDRETRTRERKRRKTASGAAFTKDGLEIAFVAGGDLYVMDTVLKEPKQITATPEDEGEALFTADGKALLFVATRGGQGDLCRAERKDPEKYWWQNDEFVVTNLSDDPANETALSLSPDGKKIAFVRGRGDLVVMNVDGSDERVIASCFDRPSYSWSPDGFFMAYAASDHEFNSDIFITRTDGSGEPVNVSRHPDSDWNPAWSPDGRILAFLSRRGGDNESDIHYVWLREEDEEQTKRERTIAEALEKMKKGRKAGKKKAPAAPPKGADGKTDPKEPGKKPDPKGEPEPKEPVKKVEPAPKAEPAPKVEPDPKAKPEPGKEPDPQAEPAPKKEPDPKEPAKAEPKEGGAETPDAAKKEKPEKKPEPMAIDFDRIHDRVRSISIKDVRESNLFWSPDGKKLAFAASIAGKNGTYTVTFPDDLKPKLMTPSTGSAPSWVKTRNAIRWLVRGVPTVTTGPKSTGYAFDVWQEVDVAGRFGAGFDVAWRIMRDYFYDARMNSRNWDEIRKKYRDAATRAPDRTIFQKVVSMMIGELNASHGGFSVSPDRREGYRDEWAERTGHLGIRWDRSHAGPGLSVLDVVPDGPAERVASRVRAGEVVVSIDGTPVEPMTDLSAVLTGRPDRDVELEVLDAKGEKRMVVIRPTSLSSVRRLLYAKWVRDNENAVVKASKGKLGYLHVRGMNWGSFYEFERQLYAAGYGRDGLVIDVRNNGGGFTADHLLTALTQPTHAYTISRGGGPGYPQDRKVYATWKKPIVVLINQGSFSNAEIFAHAIRTLGRGRLVGVQTAGGVISTGGARVMDFGFIRTPGRGWFLRNDGQDMEQNGAKPDFEVWPEPGDIGRGIDRQLDKAVEVLLEDVAEWRKTGQLPKPVYRSMRGK